MKSEFSDTLKRGAARCPRFDSCNAPVCPLDDWQRAQHLQGEAVCLWLREAVKPGGIARIATAAAAAIADIVDEALPAIMASSCDIRHKLKAASRSGSKLASMHAARELLGRPATFASGDTSTPAAAVYLAACSDGLGANP
ncbi:MAG: hypothetical protein ABI227_05890 [Rhodanobacter sp.]